MGPRLTPWPPTPPPPAYSELQLASLSPWPHRMQKAASRPPLADRATGQLGKENGNGRDGTEKQLRVSNSCACLGVLGKGPGRLIHLAAKSAKIAVKSRAKNTSKNTCRLPWLRYGEDCLQTRPVRTKRRKQEGSGSPLK